MTDSATLFEPRTVTEPRRLTEPRMFTELHTLTEPGAMPDRPTPILMNPVTDTVTAGEAPTRALDGKAQEAFADRLLDCLNGAGLMLMTSIGHRTRLFDAMALLPPSTSVEIAEAAGLNERYVREWLGAMVAGRIVNYDSFTRRYLLPPEHAACLTRVASPNNMAVFAQFVSVLASVEDRVTECFRKGGGVGYDEFPRFQQVMAEESEQTVAAALESAILPIAPGLVEQLEEGIDVLDVGCGSGRALNQMARRFPNSRFTGYDLSLEGVRAGRQEARICGTTNVRFEVRDVSFMPDRRQFDLITAFDAIHDQADPARVLERIHTALRAGGTFLMQDIKASSHPDENVEHPLGAFLYTISCMHCMTVSLAQGGAGLGACWGVDLAQSMLTRAGFGSVDVNELPHDPMNVFFVCKLS